MDALVRTFNEPRRRLLFFLFLCFLMVVYAEIGASLSPGDLGFSTLWPPSGLYYTALVFAPALKRDWIGIFFAAAPCKCHFRWFFSQCFIHSDAFIHW